MFNNVFFLLLFSLIALSIYYVLGNRKKEIYLCIVNIVFYCLLEQRYALLLFFSIGITFSVIHGAVYIKNRKVKRCIGIAGITYVVVVLCIYKYFSFFTNDMSSVMKLTMPIGISYYSFKMISALIDVCIKDKKWDYSIQQYAIYISFFPQILCGPIARIDWFDFSEGIEEKNRIDCTESIYLIILGLFKKVVIAERLAIYTSVVFANYEDYPAVALWVNAIFYSIQLYCDFSGYSDIAVALTRLFGFKCEENFKTPYFSITVKDFWNRWHISLSKWLRDYIYIPLGGNRVGEYRRVVNTLIVFGISGIWHGNTINFLLWGMWHALLNLLSPKIISEKRRFLYGISTFLLVTIGWIFFYYPITADAVQYIGSMMKDMRLSIGIIIQTVLPFTMDYACFAHLGVIFVMMMILFLEEYRYIRNRKINYDIIRGIQIICIILFGVMGENSFVYANF